MNKTISAICLSQRQELSWEADYFFAQSNKIANELKDKKQTNKIQEFKKKKNVHEINKLAPIYELQLKMKSFYQRLAQINHMRWIKNSNSLNDN